MDTLRLNPVTKKFADHSTAKGFAFSFFCDKCGKEWRSAPQAFQPGPPQVRMDIRIYRMLWSHQHKAAYEQANLESLYEFTQCPACGRRLCMECFCLSETEVAEVCRGCLSAVAASVRTTETHKKTEES